MFELVMILTTLKAIKIYKGRFQKYKGNQNDYFFHFAIKNELLRKFEGLWHDC